MSDDASVARWPSDAVGRVARDTAIVVAILACVAVAAWPGRPRVALGVLGGGVLVGLSFWAIRGGVDGVLRAGRAGGRGAGADAGAGAREAAEAGESAESAEPGAPVTPMTLGWPLVKIFTRHAILAVAAYGMMVRLRLDPVGMLVGVSAIVAAAAAEALRFRSR